MPGYTVGSISLRNIRICGLFCFVLFSDKTGSSYAAQAGIQLLSQDGLKLPAILSP